MRSKNHRSPPNAGGLTSRREVLRRGALVAAASIVAPSLPRFARAAGVSAGFDYYISPQGADSNPGTVSQPWAITSLRDTSPNNGKMAGKRVGLLPGTYNIGGMTSGSSPGDYEHSILAPPAGSSSSPTYIGSSDSTGAYSPRTATILWNGSQTTNGIIGPNPNNGYVTIDGLIVNGGGLAGTHLFQAYSSTTSIYTSAGTMQGIVVKNCEMYNINATDTGNNDAAVFLEGCDGAVVQNNYFHDIVKPPQQDHCHAYEEYGCQNCKILYNTLVNVSGGIESKAGSGGTEVAYNYIYSSPYAALVGFDGANGNPNTPNIPYSIHHNIFDSNPIALIGDQNITVSTQDINFYNNTVYDPRSGSLQEVRLGTNGVAKATSYNNILYVPAVTAGGNNMHPGVLNVSSGGYGTLDYNCYLMGSFNMGKDGSTYSSLSAWRSATGAESHSMTADPGFVSAITAGNGPAQFQLSGNSPCKGSGQGGANMGAWDGTVTQIGCNFAPNSVSTSAPADPNAPVLSVS